MSQENAANRKFDSQILKISVYGTRIYKQARNRADDGLFERLQAASPRNADPDA